MKTLLFLLPTVLFTGCTTVHSLYIANHKITIAGCFEIVNAAKEQQTEEQTYHEFYSRRAE